ncbi:MAG: GNAT family N-acetyltransferase [Nocardioidaceae bacterium]
MWVGPIDVHDDALLRGFWEAGREGDEDGRAHSTFWAWKAAEVSFRAANNSVSQNAIAAIDDGVVVGASQVILPLLDNKHVAYIEPIVRPAHRRRGVGTALLAATIDLCRAHGRTTLIGEVNQQLDGSPCPGRTFMEGHGFTVASEEIHRVLDLPVESAQIDALEASTVSHRDGYRLVSWDDRVPDEHIEGFAQVQIAFNEEAPTGELDIEPEHWDEARIRATEERAARQGRRECVTVAIDPAGEIVAMTQMMRVDETPTWGAQGLTLVMPEHRGHRLGMAIKVANLRRYQERFDSVRAVHSWNAQENGPMIAINETLGFRPVERLLEMQRKL